VLPGVLQQLERPALFWLDGHYSGGITAQADRHTPIVQELIHIFSSASPGHVVLVDDARCFGTDPQYPTLPRLRELVLGLRPDRVITTDDDCIRITPATGQPNVGVR
jgi:hypothetical protein